MDSREYEKRLKELETQIDRLRSLYDQYFRGIEKMAPIVLQKKVDKEIRELRKVHVRTTAIRFKLQMQVQKYTTYLSYWKRVMRMLEEGQMKRGPGVLILVPPGPRPEDAGEAGQGMEATPAEDDGFDIPIDFSDEEDDDATTVPPPSSLRAIVAPALPPPAPLPADLVPPPHPDARARPSPAPAPAEGRPSRPPVRRPPPASRPGEVRRVPLVPIEEKIRAPSDAPRPALVPVAGGGAAVAPGLAARKPASRGRMIGAKPSSKAPEAASGEDGGSGPGPGEKGGGLSR